MKNTGVRRSHYLKEELRLNNLNIAKKEDCKVIAVGSWAILWRRTNLVHGWLPQANSEPKCTEVAKLGGSF